MGAEYRNVSDAVDPRPQLREDAMMRTFDIPEAAEFLKIDRTTVLELAGAGELPGAKVGRAWVFLEADLIEYLRDKVRRQTNERRELAAFRSGNGGDPERVETELAGSRTARRTRRLPPPSLV